MIKKIAIVILSIVLSVSLFLNIYAGYNNPHFGATISWLDFHDDYSVGILYNGDKYYPARTLFSQDKLSYIENEYWFKPLSNKQCRCSDGSFWFSIFTDINLNFFEDDPNNVLLHCELPDWNFDNYYKEDIVFPTVETDEIDCIYFGASVMHYEAIDDYYYKITDKNKIEKFQELYCQNNFEKWVRKIVEEQDISDCLITVSYEDYPFYQKVIDVETEKGKMKISKYSSYESLKSQNLL